MEGLLGLNCWGQETVTCGMILPNLNTTEILLTAYQIVGGEVVTVTSFRPFKLPRV